MDIREYENKKTGLKLFARGNTDCLEGATLGVVGARAADERLLRYGQSMVEDACKISGRTIVSGLALGCDAAGHRGALRALTPTVAVLPCAIGKIKPAANANLAGAILAAGGCLVSEYPIGKPFGNYMYIERDAVIARLSDALIVLGCEVKSGTMHTVDEALELGRPVGCMMVEGLITPGCRKLVEEGKAVAITSREDLEKFLENIAYVTRRFQLFRKHPGDRVLF